MFDVFLMLYDKIVLNIFIKMILPLIINIQIILISFKTQDFYYYSNIIKY